MLKALIPFAVLSAANIYLGTKLRVSRKEANKLLDEYISLSIKNKKLYMSLIKNRSDCKSEKRKYERKIAALEHEKFILEQDKIKDSIDSYCDLIKRDLENCVNNDGTYDSVLGIYEILRCSTEKCIRDMIKEKYEDYADKKKR